MSLRSAGRHGRGEALHAPAGTRQPAANAGPISVSASEESPADGLLGQCEIAHCERHWTERCVPGKDGLRRHWEMHAASLQAVRASSLDTILSEALCYVETPNAGWWKGNGQAMRADHQL